MAPLGILVQAAIIGFAIQGKAQNNGADLVLDYTVPLTTTVGVENTNTAVVTNSGPDTASVSLFQFTNTPGLVTLLDISTSQGTCVENNGAGFSGFDCELGDVSVGMTVTTTLTWMASAPGVVETVALQNVGAINPNDGTPVTITGLPIAGATITVQP